MSTLAIILLGTASLLVLYIATRNIYMHRANYKEGKFPYESISKYGMVEYSTYNPKKDRFSTKYIHIRDFKFITRDGDQVTSVDYSTLLEVKEHNKFIASKITDLFTLVFLQTYFRIIHFAEKYQSMFSNRYYYILIYDIVPFILKRRDRLIIHPAYFYWGDIDSVIIKWLKAVKRQDSEYLLKNTFLNEVIDYLIYTHVCSIVEKAEKFISYPIDNRFLSQETHSSLKNILEIESAKKIEESMYDFLRRFKDSDRHYFRQDHISKMFLNQE